MAERGNLMAHCPNCGEELSSQARFCPHCGAAQRQARSSPEQLALPGTGFGLGPPALQPAGGGAVALPAAGPAGRPLTAKQVAIAVGAVMLLLLGFILYNGYRSSGVPVVGVVGEPITLGQTMVGVADIGMLEQWEGHAAQRGQFLAVAIVVANNGSQPFTLDADSFALINGRNGERYQPVFMAYGMPDELNAGKYQRSFRLGPKEIIAAIAIFDIAREVTQPRLLVCDMTQSGGDFTGAIDLTRETQRQGENEQPESGVKPLMEFSS